MTALGTACSLVVTWIVDCQQPAGSEGFITLRNKAVQSDEESVLACTMSNVPCRKV
jgi:hypothetical protein